MRSLAKIRASENGSFRRSETFDVSPIHYYRTILGLKNKRPTEYSSPRNSSQLRILYLTIGIRLIRWTKSKFHQLLPSSPYCPIPHWNHKTMQFKNHLVSDRSNLFNFLSCLVTIICKWDYWLFQDFGYEMNEKLKHMMPITFLPPFGSYLTE